MNDIEKMQYNNLREGFQLLVDTILGEDYYNTGMDLYTCDLLCCLDIINAYNHRKIKKVKNPFDENRINFIIEKSIYEEKIRNMKEYENMKENNNNLNQKISNGMIFHYNEFSIYTLFYINRKFLVNLNTGEVIGNITNTETVNDAINKIAKFYNTDSKNIKYAGIYNKEENNI